MQVLSHGVDRDSVLAAVGDEGRTTGRYIMMSVLSAAIATLGLLLSSPAVVIGAMLISPLMGPIILLGFSFWTVDWHAMRRAILSLTAGLGVALLVALVLTWLSPLKEPTAEILSRTRPNLFDLLVAAFSGIAGGYAVIRQRGETVIGVAIATALMPPIATVGFGLGTANWTIAFGALLLFATNLIAIALAAAVMAALYGFGPGRASPGGNWIGRAAVVLVVVALCVPLTVSLNTIALESRATVAARAEIQKLFGARARLTSLTVHSLSDGLDVEGLVATPTYVASASMQIGQRLTAALGIAAHVNLDQVVLADPARFAAGPDAPTPPDPDQVAATDLRNAVPFPTEAISYDAAAHRGIVILGPDSGLGLVGAMKLEQGLRSRAGLANTEVIPPVQPLPPIPIALSPAGQPQFGDALALDVWALERWQVGDATVALCGVAGKSDTAVAAALGHALAPLSATFATKDDARCARSDAKGAFAVLSPATLTPPQPTATASAGK